MGPTSNLTFQFKSDFDSVSFLRFPIKFSACIFQRFNLHVACMVPR